MVSTNFEQANFWALFEFKFKLNYNLNFQRLITQNNPMKMLVMSGPGVCICNSSHDAIIWRAESRTHLSKKTRPSTKHSRKALNVRGIPYRPDDQLRWVLLVLSQV